MATTLEHITQTYHEICKDLATPEQWQLFLQCACKNYKCRFDEQALIYAQRPDATAVLEIAKWNKRFGRWVNRGATGIGVFESMDGKRVKYYFDVDDTHESDHSKQVPIWQMQDRYESAVMDSLEATFGTLANTYDLQQAIICAAENAAEDNLADYLSQLMISKENSLLEEVPDEYIKKNFKELLANSIAYMMLARCGYDVTDYFDDSDFEVVRDFNTHLTLNAVGIATSDIAEVALREISSTVISLENSEKKHIRTFAGDARSRYTNATPTQTANERMEHHEGNHLQPTRGLLSPEPNHARTIPQNDWEIRTPTQDLSGAEPTRNLHQPADVGAVAQPSGEHRRASERADGTADETASQSAGRDGAAESSRPDGMGGRDEQHSPPSRGSSAQRTDLQLIDLPTVEQQQEIIEQQAEVQATSAFVISQGVIDRVLQGGSNISRGKFRIFAQFEKKQTKKENVAFLKEEYGWGGCCPVLIEPKIDEMHDNKGIHLTLGSLVTPTETVHLSWPMVEKRIDELIKLNRYLNAAEIEAYPDYIEERKIESERVQLAAQFRALVQVYNDYQTRMMEPEKCLNTHPLYDAAQQLSGGDRYIYTTDSRIEVLPIALQALRTIMSENTPQSEEAAALLPRLELISLRESAPPVQYEYRYHLGDTVYLGADELEILSFSDEEVLLYDPTFPLMNQTMSRADFDEGIKGNPANRHLRVPIEPFAEVEPVPVEAAVDDAQATEQAEVEPSPSEVEQEQTEQTEPQREAPITPEEASETPAPTDNNSLIGRQFVSEERRYEIEEINARSEVSLRDITFAQAVGFPITRLEPLAVVERMLAAHEQTEAKEKVVLAAPKKPKRQGKVQQHNLHPEVPQSERSQFALNSHSLTFGNAKEKYHANIAAITTLKLCEQENRYATPAEQETLVQYVGWGGLSDAFDPDKTAWANEYAELKELLSDTEYAAARASTLTAFYTPTTVISAMYSALDNMGFAQGNILEPSCGTGYFIGALPSAMQQSKVYGVELDSITGHIAQQLYQKSNIAVQGYEETNLPDSFFDVAIGNVPFGQFKVADKKYDRNNFMIHDYFFGKTLDKIRPNGVIAFVTSKGTLDKTNSAVRRYIAQRAEFLGAIRLPNNTFKANAGTEVTSDIIFLQKRDRFIDKVEMLFAEREDGTAEHAWLQLATNSDGICMNQYFVDNPDMILGEMREVSGPYGPETACLPLDGQSLDDLLAGAIAHIHADYQQAQQETSLAEEDVSLPADPDVRNFSYTMVDGVPHFRENSIMFPVELSATATSRVKGMIAIRDCVRELIALQTEDAPDDEITPLQAQLNTLYDDYTKKYGLLSSRANSTAFSNDSSYCLLCSLEQIDENGNLERKADMFSKRTIKAHSPVTKVDTASEALAVSIAEKAGIDPPYMEQLTGKPFKELAQELSGAIFAVPTEGGTYEEAMYETADAYLSGNVRKKLALATEMVSQDMRWTTNVSWLQKVQPVDLTASEIAVRLGATWIPPEVIKQFMFELLDTPRYKQWQMTVNFSAFTSTWNIPEKNRDKTNIKAISTYGTARISAYKIIEETLNLKDVRIFDYETDDHGNRVAVLNKKETAIAQAKQEQIKAAFVEWIWKDPVRRENLTRMYNDKFNSIRPREYDGQHIQFGGINPEIQLRIHQINAIAHIIYGGNTLLAHVVGAGKTFEMIAAAMEMKRLGICHKSLFVVPNHLTEQWATEFLQLYPAANILVATKKDFETKNRKKFCARIATGDFDAVIIGHSQFEKIPMSIARQRMALQEQLDDVVDGIVEAKSNSDDKFSVKQLEKTKKSLQIKLDKLNDQSRKDDVVTFEELGVDRLFIDESHFYKNLFLYTKMRNVAGIAQTEAQKSSDLFMKARYLDEITGGRGLIFATGTPISNSMVELYTVQRYLQYNALQENSLQHFDAWASTFGETVTAIELAPEGTGYRAKTRFAKFYNLPELMTMFKEVADIQTADMLKLPVPEVEYHNVSIKPSEMQTQMVEELATRAQEVRNKMVDPSVDNMLRITNDGRKLALDQRMINPMLPDEESSKVNACAQNIYHIWEESTEQKSAQLMFCNLSTPKKETQFSVYTDMRHKLIAMGIPAEEICFIHDADTEVKKKELFAKVRKGDVRVLFGSTAKMGAGTNVQQRLIALHDLDCPWRPSDLEQRSGRIIRQGNTNPKVEIFRYVTEQTFDAYLFQLVESKQKFISQIMTSKSPVRSAEDVDETALSYAEIKMLATGNPHIKEKMDLDIQVARLKLLKQSHLSERYSLEDKVLKAYPQTILALENRIKGLTLDRELAFNHTPTNEEKFLPMVVHGITYPIKAEAGAVLIEACQAMQSPDEIPLGEYRGFQMALAFLPYEKEYQLTLRGALSYQVSLGADPLGNITRIENQLSSFDVKLMKAGDELENTKAQLENAKAEIARPFAQEEVLAEKSARLDALNILLNMDKTENEVMDGDISEDAATPESRSKAYER